MTDADDQFVYEFEGFHLDPQRMQLLTPSDQDVRLLTPRTFDTLLFLVEHPGELLTKDRLMAAVWPDTVVAENNLNQKISTLRGALGEKPGDHRFIVTVPGRGYRFVAPVRRVPAATRDSRERAGPWGKLFPQHRRFWRIAAIGITSLLAVSISAVVVFGDHRLMNRWFDPDMAMPSAGMPVRPADIVLPVALSGPWPEHATIPQN